MTEEIDIQNWKRKQHFEHFSTLKDPSFGVTIPFNVTNAYTFSKKNAISFFGTYLHSCLVAINAIDELKMRVENNKVLKFDTIHASPTIMRPNKTFGFSFIDYDEDLEKFIDNLNLEKQRILTTNELFPPKNGLNCMHCSALPWIDFSGHKEPVSGQFDSIPKFAFGKTKEENGKMMMNVAITVNHALVDGYHVGQFSEAFQNNLNRKN